MLHRFRSVTCSHDMIGRVMIQCARQPGLAAVWEQLMGFRGVSASVPVPIMLAASARCCPKPMMCMHAMQPDITTENYDLPSQVLLAFERQCMQ